MNYSIDSQTAGARNLAPDLAVGERRTRGFWKAIEEVSPSTRHQRCWVHKTANVLNKVALSVQVNMKADLREIYGAPTRAAAEAAIDVFADKYCDKYDKAVACLERRDRRSSLASPFFDFPAEPLGPSAHVEPHRERIRHRASSHCAYQRSTSRRKPRSSWCLNSSMPPQKHGGD